MSIGETKPDNFGNVYANNGKLFYMVSQSATYVAIKASVEEIYGVDENTYAFYQNKNIQSVTFDEGSQLKVISAYAFYKCAKIQTIDLSKCSHLTKIRKFAFAECGQLSSITFPHSLTTLESFSFKSTGLTSFTVPNSIVDYQANVLHYSLSVETVTFEEGFNLTYLPTAVIGGTKVSTFTIPKSVEELKGGAFWAADNLAEIKVEIGNKNFTVVNGLLLTSDGKKLILCPKYLTKGEIIIPDTVDEVLASSCSYAVFTSVKIPNSVKKIGGSSFGYTKLKSVDIPDSVTTIGNYAFAFCTDLTDIKLPNNITYIDQYCFHGTGIVSIELPDSIVKLCSGCFSDCKNLLNMTLPINLTEFGGGAFSGSENITLKFPPGSRFAIDDQNIITYENGTKICQYLGFKPITEIIIPKNVIEIEESTFQNNLYFVKVTCEAPSSLRKIGLSAFSGCKNLASMEFPDSLVNIESECFDKSGLHEIRIGKSIQKIGNRAFKECINLSKVIFDTNSNEQELGKEVFNGCVNLSSITFSEGLISIGDYFLRSTTALKEVVFPSTLRKVGSEAFWHSGVEKITFNLKSARKSLTAGSEQTASNGYSFINISYKAFSEANSLSSFQFVDGLQIIGPFAFEATNLTEVIIPSSIVVIDRQCFQNCPNLINVSVMPNSHLETFGFRPFFGSMKLEIFECNNNNFMTENTAFYGDSQKKLIYFPPSSKTHFLGILSSVEVIEPNTFQDCHGIYSILIPDDSKIKDIGANSFDNCDKLHSINIPGTVETIGYEAFKGCTDLSCGLIIINRTQEFLTNLVENAKMPKRCLISCYRIEARSLCLCNINIPSTSVFAAFLFLI